ncbi:MAG: nucleotidyl transferase AbiEii/AbiGii toxin family protein [bacterium]
MNLTMGQLSRIAAETRFRAEPLEKVLRLLDLLSALDSHPYLTDRLALKGGTALNLFVLDLPRLSVDIDVNYVGSAGRQSMLDERPQVEEAIGAVCARQDLRVRRVPEDHAGGKWRLTYDRAQGGTGTLELDLNFLLRTPLWVPERRDSPAFLGVQVRGFPLLNPHELAAGKLAALFGRNASRDLYDATRLLKAETFDPRDLRLAFVLYGAMNRRDWRTVSLDQIEISPKEAERMLIPLLREDLAPERHRIESWGDSLVEECRERLGAVLPFEAAEVEFLDRINDHGDVRPELLTEDADLQERIRTHPGLLWKATNVARQRSR